MASFSGKHHFLFVYSYVHTYLVHISPHPSDPPTPPHPLSLPGRIYSALISNFVEERV
jgi:hypothetical protein